jgi:Fic family protein
MAWVERRWHGDPAAMGGRKARQSFTYRAFLPDPIAAIRPSVGFATAESIARAEVAIRDLNAEDRVRGLDAIGALLLRSEAIASSRIEGIELSQRNLARALIDPRASKGSARAVAANVLAMEEAVEAASGGADLTVSSVEALHRTLMADEPERVMPGRFRDDQDWIGGRRNNPSDARYIPPPGDHVPALMSDLVDFIDRGDMPAVAQAAIAHAQFETIHPFVDGNGRVGRCLIHIVLRRRGVARSFVRPVSIVLAARPGAYVAGLVDFREGRVESWIADFAEACRHAAESSAELAVQVTALQVEWHERAGRPRRDSAAARIIGALPAQPIASAATIRGAIGARHQRALEGLKVLADAEVLRQISSGTYDRQYAADELFELLEEYEAEVASRTRRPERSAGTSSP